jgi:hypothetical protein
LSTAQTAWRTSGSASKGADRVRITSVIVPHQFCSSGTWTSGSGSNCRPRLLISPTMPTISQGCDGTHTTSIEKRLPIEFSEGQYRLAKLRLIRTTLGALSYLRSKKRALQAKERLGTSGNNRGGMIVEHKAAYPDSDKAFRWNLLRGSSSANRPKKFVWRSAGKNA